MFIYKIDTTTHGNLIFLITQIRKF